MNLDSCHRLLYQVCHHLSLQIPWRQVNWFWKKKWIWSFFLEMYNKRLRSSSHSLASLPGSLVYPLTHSLGSNSASGSRTSIRNGCSMPQKISEGMVMIKMMSLYIIIMFFLSSDIQLSTNSLVPEAPFLWDYTKRKHSLVHWETVALQWYFLLFD